MRISLLLLSLLTLACTSLSAADPASLESIAVKTLEGKETTMKEWKGRVLLIVNVASACGYTSQYQGLQALHEKYEKQGLTVMGVPCNDFGGQEPGSAEEIRAFCSASYHVTFPMLEKVSIQTNPHPLYAYLTSAQAARDVQWNFVKFLVGRDGKVMAQFDSDVEPDAPQLMEAVEKALAEK